MQFLVELLVSSLFQPRAHQKVDTIEVLLAICQTCQSWKPLFDSWTTHSHWEHFDFPARLPGSPALSPAPWRHEWPALSGTSRGAECTDSPGGEQMGPELSDSSGEEAGGSSVRGESWCPGDRWYSVGRCQVCQCEFPWSDLYSDWQGEMGWLTTVKCILYTHIWCLMQRCSVNWSCLGKGVMSVFCFLLFPECLCLNQM